MAYNRARRIFLYQLVYQNMNRPLILLNPLVAMCRNQPHCLRNRRRNNRSSGLLNPGLPQGKLLLSILLLSNVSPAAVVPRLNFEITLLSMGSIISNHLSKATEAGTPNFSQFALSVSIYGIASLR